MTTQEEWTPTLPTPMPEPSAAGAQSTKEG